jgi:hypothetical protein
VVIVFTGVDLHRERELSQIARALGPFVLIRCPRHRRHLDHNQHSDDRQNDD